MLNPFHEVMGNHPDAKLIDIVENKRGDYQQDALSAAEAILRKRRVSFRQHEPDEIIEMTVDEIRGEIIQRTRNGESLRQIKRDFESKGVDIDEMEEEDAGKMTPEKTAADIKKSKQVWFIGGSCIAVLLRLSLKNEFSFVFLLIAFVVGIVMYLRLRK